MSLKRFEYWINKASKAQRVHEDAGDEMVLSSVSGDARAKGLIFSKELAKTASLEAAPTLAPKGPSAPGMGAQSSAMNLTKTRAPKPPTTKNSGKD